MTTRFRTRAFAICFVPFAALLAAGFWMVQQFVQSTVREGLRASLTENQAAIAGIHAKGDLQNSRFLKVAGENAALKAGMQLLLTHAGNQTARRTVEDQLRELGEHMGFDLLVVSGPDGAPLAGVVRSPSASAGQLEPIDPAQLAPLRGGLFEFGRRTFQVASVPIDQDDGNFGTLSVGEYFNFSEFATPAVLLHDSQVIASNLNGVSFNELNSALAACNGSAECNLRLHGANWISMPVQLYAGGYTLRSLDSVDRVAGPIQSRLHDLFLSLGLVCVLLALLCSMAASDSMVKPIAGVVSHLRKAAHTGVLSEFQGLRSSILEVRELAEFYNQAAVSVRAAGQNLEAAYLEFVGSLANALDARDRYTSGHSVRVSQISCAIARAMQLSAEDVERIRIGALLHDIGKIGVADGVLQKPGKLTPDEYAMVKEHPDIGRRILEGVHGFAPYLPAVELHHENWDGTGYPKGLAGEQTPIDARIIHVADAYDAMTTDRSYRSGMTHERALAILIEYAGKQFDPRIVDIFLSLTQESIATGLASGTFTGEWEEEDLIVAG